MGVAARFIEPIDKGVNTHLKSLVRFGCRRLKELQNRAKEFVVNAIFSGTTLQCFEINFILAEGNLS